MTVYKIITEYGQEREWNGYRKENINLTVTHSCIVSVLFLCPVSFPVRFHGCVLGHCASSGLLWTGYFWLLLADEELGLHGLEQTKHTVVGLRNHL